MSPVVLRVVEIDRTSHLGSGGVKEEVVKGDREFEKRQTNTSPRSSTQRPMQATPCNRIAFTARQHRTPFQVYSTLNVWTRHQETKVW